MSINDVRNAAAGLLLMILLSACSTTKNLELDSQFPIPVMTKTPVSMDILLDEELKSFTYQEVIEAQGEWNVAIGPVQEKLFTNLAQGMFEQYALVDAGTTTQADAILKPAITDLQFSLPEQTRSDFYEVWIRYKFQLFDTQGQLVAEWPLPAYGKASKKDYGSAYKGVEAAAIAACRDAMAFFAINFTKEPKIKAWLENRTRPTEERVAS